MIVAIQLPTGEGFGEWNKASYFCCFLKEDSIHGSVVKDYSALSAGKSTKQPDPGPVLFCESNTAI